jgi:hypothetical protein
VQNLLFRGHLSDCRGDAGVHIADDKVDVIPLDQLAGLLHTGADVIG